LTVALNKKSDECPVCIKQYRKFHPMTKHHISYFPEIIIYVHDDCHDAIHQEPISQYIQFKKHDSLHFYKPNQKPFIPDVIPEDFDDRIYI
jgi:hypothetical protein